MKEEPKLTAIPHFLVEAVVELPVALNLAYAIRNISRGVAQTQGLPKGCKRGPSTAICGFDAGREAVSNGIWKAEMMAVAIMRAISDGDIVFHGLASSTPMVAMKAAKALGKNFTYVTLSDGVDHDYLRPPTVASTLTANTYEGSVAAFGLDEIFDLYASGKGDIAFLSCLQMDKEGRIAMSYLGGTYDNPKLRGPGGPEALPLLR